MADRDTKGRFVKGAQGNPNGRPKGARSKLSEDFFGQLYDTWQRKGAEVLDNAADAEPMQFAKMVAGLMPREFTVTNELDELDRDRLARLVDALERAEAAAGEDAAEAGGPRGEAPAREVPPVH